MPSDPPPLPPDTVRRLHPLTLVQRLVVSLPAVFFALLPVLRNPDRSGWILLLVGFLYGAVAIPWIFLHYRRFRYHLTPKELIIRQGVLTRQHRNIPIERIQNIEIEQALLPRLFGTAKVKVETAGSTKAEGVLEYVSLAEAQRIREVVRAYQRHQAETTTMLDTLTDGLVAPPQPAATPDVALPAPLPTADAPRPIFTMTRRDVLRSGAYRFSILYIALIFSALQYWEPDPEAVVDWVARGRFAPLLDVAAASPWLTAVAGILSAALLAWLTGIAVNLNRFFQFRLWREGQKLHRQGGLLTKREGTIPIPKIQALILQTNPLMRRFGWHRLELQTMGLDEQQGHQIAVPFAQRDHIERLSAHIYRFTLPTTFHPVSLLHFRRSSIRYGVALLLMVAPGGYFFPPFWWGLLLLVPAVWYAYGQYRYHGYAVEDGKLFVRRGVIRQKVWIMPVEKFQVFYVSQSLFQRRLGLKTLHVDTAGALALGFPEIIDLPAAEADTVLEALYTGFQLHFSARKATPAVPNTP